MARRRKRSASGKHAIGEAAPAADTLLLTVPAGASVAFVGSCYARVLSGSAIVLGAVLAPSGDERALHSPAGGAVLALEAADDCALEVLLRAVAPMGRAGVLGAGSHGSPPRLTARGDADGDDEALAAALKAHLNLTLVAHAGAPARTGALLPSEWVGATNLALACLRESPVVLLCGPRNSGKSTFLRYLCNRALEDWDSVCLLECDVGQPELNPPGLVALHTLHEPLLGPPHAHGLRGRATLGAVFLGDVTPSSDPKLYVAAVRKLADAHRAGAHAGAPLFVNTCGWVRGLGLALLAETVQALRPSQIIELYTAHKELVPVVAEAEADDAAEPAEPVDEAPPRCVGKGAPRLDLSELGVGEAFGLQPRLHSLPSLERLPAAAAALAQLATLSVPPNPNDLRAWQLMAYFANALEPAAPAAPHSTGDRGGLGAQEWRSPAAWRQLAAGLAVAPAAVVGLRHVRLALSHHQVPPSELLWTLNAALVALCVDEREGLCAVRLDARLSALDVPSLPPGHAPSGAEEAVARAAALDAEPAGSVSLFVLPESPLADCLGLGIVRAIDVARGELHILTPLPLAQLQRVNTVVRGNLQLPAALIIGGAQPMAAMPYLTAESVTAAGAASMRSRNNLERATTARR